MAVREDLLVCDRQWREWRLACPDAKCVLSCSGNAEQQELLTRLYPRSIISNLTVNGWNLNDPCPKQPAPDIIVACNVFHYAPQPWIWFYNIFASCKYFWMQDLVMRQRGNGGGEFGNDGDCMRYMLGCVLAHTPGSFDLMEHGKRLVDYHCYDAGSLQERKTLINFVACFKGDLA